MTCNAPPAEQGEWPVAWECQPAPDRMHWTWLSYRAASVERCTAPDWSTKGPGYVIRSEPMRGAARCQR